MFGNFLTSTTGFPLSSCHLQPPVLQTGQVGSAGSAVGEPGLPAEQLQRCHPSSIETEKTKPARQNMSLGTKSVGLCVFKIITPVEPERGEGSGDTVDAAGLVDHGGHLDLHRGGGNVSLEELPRAPATWRCQALRCGARGWSAAVLLAGTARRTRRRGMTSARLAPCTAREGGRRTSGVMPCSASGAAACWAGNGRSQP